MKQHAGLIWGLIGAAIAALGTVKTLLSLSTGSEFTLQKAGFYVGATALLIWFAACAAIFVGGALVLIAQLLLGQEKSEADAVTHPILFIAGAAGLLFAVGLVFSDLLDYEGTDAFGRGAFAFIGLAALATTIYMWRKNTKATPTGQ